MEIIQVAFSHSITILNYPIHPLTLVLEQSNIVISIIEMEKKSFMTMLQILMN